MAQKALLWRIVLAVAFAGHWLAKLFVMGDFNEPVTRIMTSPVAVQDGLLVERNAVVTDEDVYCPKHEVHLHQSTHPYASTCFVKASSK